MHLRGLEPVPPRRPVALAAEKRKLALSKWRALVVQRQGRIKSGWTTTADCTKGAGSLLRPHACCSRQRRGMFIVCTSAHMMPYVALDGVRRRDPADLEHPCIMSL